MVPELIESFETIALESDRSVQFWLTVRVPEDAEAREYHGTLQIHGEAGVCEVPLTIAVRPFALAENTTVWQEVFYHYKSAIFPTQPMSRHILHAEMKDLVDHGINMVHTQYYPAVRKATDGSIAFDFASLDPLLDALKETGMHAWTPVSLYFAHFDAKIADITGVNWGDLGFEKIYIDGVNRLTAYVKERGFVGLLLRVEDEPGNFPSLQKEVEHTLRALQKSQAISYANTGGVDDWVKEKLPHIAVSRIYGLTDER